MFRLSCKKLCAFFIVILVSLRKKPSADTIIDARFTHISDEQATRIKRRLEKSRQRTRAAQKEKVS